MATDEEPSDDLRVRLTWPQPSPAEKSPFDFAADRRGAEPDTADLTPAGGIPAAPPRPPVGRTSPNYPAEYEGSGDAPSRRPLSRWAVGRRAAAQRAAVERAEAARAASEQAAAERAAAQQAAAQRAAVQRADAQRAEAERADAQRAEMQRAEAQHAEAQRTTLPPGGAPPPPTVPPGGAPPPPAQTPTTLPPRAEANPAPPRAQPEPAPGGQAQSVAELRAAEEEAARVAAERATAQRQAERAEARMLAERAAAQRAAAQRAAAERVAAEAAAKRAEAEVAAERAATERAVAERAAAERAASEAAAQRATAEAAAKRAEAEAAAERAAAERAVAAADAQSRRRPLLTVDAEEDDEEDDEAGPSRHTVSTQELILAGRSDSLQAALASIALRIDALTSTTSTFRNLISDRITDYAEQVGRLAASAAGDLDDYRHLHERALDQIRRSVGEAEDNVRRLSRSVGDLDSKVGALVAAVRESGDAVDQMISDRDQVSDTLVRTLQRVEDNLVELTEGKGASSFSRLGEMINALLGERDRQAAVWAQLEETVVALADDREHEADVMVRLERAIGDMTVGRERGLAKALARLEARIDEIGAAMSGLSGDELATTLSRLDTRLKEISTELVVGRDRETAKALAQLSGQVDGISGLIAEGRTDLAPIESRLNRLARNAPQVAPIDLAGLYGRLDELAELISQPGPRAGLPAGRGEAAGSLPDRRELLERFDQLGQQLGEQLEALRRRIALRARASAPTLDEATIAAIADAVAARLQDPAPVRPSMLPSAPPALNRPGPTERGDDTPEGPRRARQQWRT